MGRSLNLNILPVLGVSEMRGGLFLSNAEEGGLHKRVNGNSSHIGLFLFVGLSSCLSLSPSPTLGTPITQH